MRRLALLVAGGVLWLVLAALPASADGGPHSLAANAGTAGLSGDCAACHRAHTAAAADLLTSDVPTLCTNCHNGTGATTDVEDGVQYIPAGLAGTGTVMGALRGGGFEYALLESSNPSRLTNNLLSSRFRGRVGVLAVAGREPVTSTHGGTGTVWGNGPEGSATKGAGPVVLDCTKCHNPHGNGQYRILRTTPGDDWSGASIPDWVPAVQAVEIADTANPTNAVLNYTVLPGSFASNVVGTYVASQGDYWRWRYPWNNSSGAHDPMQTGWNGSTPTNKASNIIGGVPTPPSNATGLMTAWCISCHTRYSGTPVAGDSSAVSPHADATFTYLHDTTNIGCEQCHVSHGSNALMTAPFSASQADPAGIVPPSVPNAGPAGSPVTSGDSRLLKVDQRGTCQMCHDPTHMPANNVYTGPLPQPTAP